MRSDSDTLAIPIEALKQKNLIHHNEAFLLSMNCDCNYRELC